MDSVSIHIDAPASEVWDLVTDVSGMGRFSPENTGARWTAGTPAEVGSRFTGSNRHGWVRWSTQCVVVESVPEELFSFEVHQSKTRWTYQLEPSDTGTLVTESRAKFGSPPLYVQLIQKTKLLGRGRDELMRDGMQRTLESMKTELEVARR
ncbi:SRPBCC family protein [Rhodococcus sp. NPDC058521]|uniref:SRPBCC family protein n=1 Tax=Rhodococcus sp. NPDC058521 TaxID=3346536 RepID=UPI003650AF90